MEEDDDQVVPLSELNLPPREENSIQRVIDYYVRKGAVLPPRQEALQQLFLAFISLSGASLYILPANLFALQYGNNYAGVLVWERETIYIVGTCVPALVVLYNATDLFLNKRRHEVPPLELAGHFIPLSRPRVPLLRDAGILLGSAISAVPLMLLSFQYHLPNVPFAVQVLQAIVVEIDNTVLHFLPIQLAMEYPIYRLPILPFEYWIKACRSYQPVSPSNEVLATRRRLLITYLNRVRKALRFCNEWKLHQYEWRFNQGVLPDVLFTVWNNDDVLHKLLQEFPVSRVACYREQTNYPRVHRVLSRVSGLLGAGLVLSSCVGYLVSPVNQLLAWTNNPVIAGVVTAPALYFLTVLLTFFGWTSGLQVYDLLSKWGPHEPKLPLEFKLYPKLYTLLTLLNLYLNLYSYAAAEELLDDSFPGEEWGELRTVLVWFVRFGISFLGITAVNDFYCVVLKKIAMYWGTHENQVISQIDYALELLVSQLEKCKEEQFAGAHIANYLADLNELDEQNALILPQPIDSGLTADEPATLATSASPEDTSKADRDEYLTEVSSMPTVVEAPRSSWGTTWRRALSWNAFWSSTTPDRRDEDNSVIDSEIETQSDSSNSNHL